MPPRTAVVGTGSAPVACMASRQVLRQLVSLSDRWDCGAPRAMEAVAATIEQALAGALLWNETAGMYAPSSGNCAQLTDVWGSALALETGAVRLCMTPMLSAASMHDSSFAASVERIDLCRPHHPCFLGPDSAWLDVLSSLRRPARPQQAPLSRTHFAMLDRMDGSEMIHLTVAGVVWRGLARVIFPGASRPG